MAWHPIRTATRRLVDGLESGDDRAGHDLARDRRRREIAADIVEWLDQRTRAGGVSQSLR